MGTSLKPPEGDKTVPGITVLRSLQQEVDIGGGDLLADGQSYEPRRAVVDTRDEEFGRRAIGEGCVQLLLLLLLLRRLPLVRAQDALDARIDQAQGAPRLLQRVHPRSRGRQFAVKSRILREAMVEDPAHLLHAEAAVLDEYLEGRLPELAIAQVVAQDSGGGLVAAIGQRIERAEGELVGVAGGQPGLCMQVRPKLIQR